MPVPACGCGQPVPDGYLCRGCTRELGGSLALAALIAPDLADAAARLLSSRETGVKQRGSEPPLPFDIRASDAHARLLAVLQRWAAPRLVSTVSGAAITVHQQLPALRQNPGAPAAHREITAAVQSAMAVVEAPAEQFGAGSCENCGQQLWSGDDQSATCRRCGTVVIGVADRRRQLAARSDRLMTPAELSGVLARLGYRVAESTISSWGTRGRIEKRPGGLYRLSDVLALAAERAARAS